MLQDGRLGQDVWFIDDSTCDPKGSPVRIGFIRSIEKVITTDTGSNEPEISITYTIANYDDDFPEEKYSYQLYADRQEAMDEAKEVFRKKVKIAENNLGYLRTQLDNIDLYTEEEED